MANIKRPDTSSKKREFLAAIRATFGKAIRTQSQGSVSKPRILIATLLILGGGALVVRLLFPDPMKIANQELFDLVNGSTFTFIGTIKEMGGSNVSGFNSTDQMIVQVDKVVPGDQQALKKFDGLTGSSLTVAAKPILGIAQNDISAVFFADPLVYAENIVVVATVVPIPGTNGGQRTTLSQSRLDEFVKRLELATSRKLEVPLRAEIGNAELIITGEVVAVRPLARGVDLRSIDNGWELFSEHRPRWKEAIIKVDKRIDKGGPKPTYVSVIFPNTHDCFFGPSPKFQAGNSGIWLLHRNQLDKQETDVLILRSDEYKGNNDVQTYTALHPADFQDISMLAKIQLIIAGPK
jgi:hypothetical protein